MDSVFELYAMHQIFDVEPVIEDIVEKARAAKARGEISFSYDLPKNISTEDKAYIEQEVQKRLAY